MRSPNSFYGVLAACLFLTFSATAQSPPVPPETFRLIAVLDSSKTIRLTWSPPENVSVLKYYIHRHIVSNTTALADPRSATLVDSTTATEYADPLSQTQSGIFSYQVWASLVARLPLGSTVATVIVPPVPVSPYIRLTGELNAEGKPSLTWFPPEGITFDRYDIYRGIYNPLSMTPMPPPLMLVDSTRLTAYVDSNPPETPSGYVYQIRGRSGMQISVSNPEIVILHEHISLRAYADFNRHANILEWNAPRSATPLYYLIYRQMLMDSASVPDSMNWAPLDTVKETFYADTKWPMTLVMYYGFAYRVAAVMPYGVLPSNVAIVPQRPVGPPRFVLGGKLLGDGGVALAWTESLPFSVEQFYLYRASLTFTSSVTSPSLAFVAVDSTTEHSLVDYPPLNVTHSFAYVVEAHGAGQLAQSNILTILFPPGPVTDRVEIVSEPLRDARVGEEYTYRPKAVSSSPSAVFVWKLGAHPPGMTIDSVSGSITWMPSMRGWYHVGVRVISSMGGCATQEYEIAVAGVYGVVEGLVTDSLGAPIRAFVRLLKRDPAVSFAYTASTDSLGRFRFPMIDAGSYIAFAVSMDGAYLPQWYLGSDSPQDATPIFVADSATVTIGFVLKPRATIPVFEIGGTVRDVSGSPIGSALVAFARIEFLLNSAKQAVVAGIPTEDLRDLLSEHSALRPATGIIQNTTMVFRTLTDGEGNYSLRIPRGVYLAASAASGYRLVFYNGAKDLLTADPIALSRDTSGIDFTLPAIPATALGRIMGTVRDTAAGTGVPARIIAFRYEYPELLDAFYADTDAEGTYEIGDLPSGTYYVLALPLGGYAPAYYSETGSAIRWLHASAVAVEGNAVTGIDIFVRRLPRFCAGYTWIFGTTHGIRPIVKAAGPRYALPPLNGAIVYAQTPDGSIAGYAVTNADGSYRIEGLAPGTYTMTADRVDYTPVTSSIAMPTYDPSGVPVSATADITLLESVTDVKDSPVLPRGFSLEQNYPNPFNPETVIRYQVPVVSSQSSVVSLRIYDVLGREIATLVDAVQQPGPHRVTWNAWNVPSGIYFYRLMADGMTVTKKMVLIK